MTFLAIKNAPIIVIEKSLPSRFNVVGIFSSVFAMKSVTIMVLDGWRFSYHLSRFSLIKSLIIRVYLLLIH
jgi:hypothetical protein